jgi:hypothetical protein
MRHLGLIAIIALFFVMPTRVESAVPNWITVVTRKDYPLPGNAGQAFSFPAQPARCIKIEGTRLRPNMGDAGLYRMQLAEIEIFIRNPTGPQSSIVNLAVGSSIAASSSFEFIGWSQDDINDGQWDSLPASMGWSSESETKIDHTEWIGLDMGSQYLVQSVILYPRIDGNGTGQGFPIDFNIQLSNAVGCFNQTGSAK